MTLFNTDVANCIKALEHFIIVEEEMLIAETAGDTKWQYLEPYRATLNNLNYLRSIYQ